MMHDVIVGLSLYILRSLRQLRISESAHPYSFLDPAVFFSDPRFHPTTEFVARVFLHNYFLAWFGFD